MFLSKADTQGNTRSLWGENRKKVVSVPDVRAGVEMCSPRGESSGPSVHTSEEASQPPQPGESETWGYLEARNS